MIVLRCACKKNGCENKIRIYPDDKNAPYIMVDHGVGGTGLLIYSSPKNLRSFARQILFRVPGNK